MEHRAVVISVWIIVAAVLLTGGTAAAQAASEADLRPASAADLIIGSIEDPQLQLLLREVVDRNPGLARLQAEARATAQRAPQVSVLPDPTASFTWFALPPETRVGPQRFAVSLMQRMPWFGTLEVEEQAVLWDAIADRADAESARLEVVLAGREAYHELQFLAAEQRAVTEERSTLEHYAELALARYASGVGTDQAVIKIQADVTRADARLLDVSARRAAIAARLNGLRDRPQATPIPVTELALPRVPILDQGRLREIALDRRPEIAAAAAGVEAAALRVESSHNASSPGLVFGLNYVNVGGRDDESGRLNPPEDNGRDILGLTAGITIPLWKSSLEARVEEDVQGRIAAEQRVREVATSVEAEIGDLAHRIPLLQEQVSLYDTVLLVQARQSLESAESAYGAGTVGALDLLDAERVLYQVRVADARARADLAIAAAKLERAIAAPLEVVR
jgi:outer membrane protein TolC